MTQKELAERAGVSLRTVERIENGENVKMDNLLNIMRVLGLMQNLDIMIPEYKVLPTEIYDTGKKPATFVRGRLMQGQDMDIG